MQPMTFFISEYKQLPFKEDIPVCFEEGPGEVSALVGPANHRDDSPHILSSDPVLVLSQSPFKIS